MALLTAIAVSEVGTARRTAQTVASQRSKTEPFSPAVSPAIIMVGVAVWRLIETTQRESIALVARPVLSLRTGRRIAVW